MALFLSVCLSLVGNIASLLNIYQICQEFFVIGMYKLYVNFFLTYQVYQYQCLYFMNIALFFIPCIKGIDASRAYTHKKLLHFLILVPGRRVAVERTEPAHLNVLEAS